MKTIADYTNPFDALEEFSKALSEFTGAKGVILTDSCTHAMELGLRYKRPNLYATLPKHTYVSVLMTLEKLDIAYGFDEEEWDKQYRIGGTHVWDCARRFEKDMYESGKIMCLSFGHNKPLEIGHGGAILTNDKQFYNWATRAAYDGRDLKISPWGDQKEFKLGFHYNMRPEDAVIGLNLLESGTIKELDGAGYKQYPDLSEITIDKE